MTETQLAEQMGLTKAAVGYHLHLLLKAGLINVDKIEVEKHGILQKYYAPKAVVLVVDPEYIPKDVERYFIRTQIERLIGVFSAFHLDHRVSKVSSKILEKLALVMLKQLMITSQKYEEEIPREDAGSLKIKIYAEAFANLIKQKEWRDLFQKQLKPFK